MQSFQGSNWLFVAAAYAAAWIVIGGYALHVTSTLRKARTALRNATGSSAAGGSWK